MCGADLTYADDWTADGLSTYYYPDIKGAGSTTPKLPVNASTYQPVWDGFGRYMQTVGNSTSVRRLSPSVCTMLQPKIQTTSSPMLLC